MKEGSQTINMKKRKELRQMVLLLEKQNLSKEADYENTESELVANLHLSVMPSHSKYKTTRSKYCFTEEFY